MDIPLITIPPLERRHTHTVIFLHDRGSNAWALSEMLGDSTDSSHLSLVKSFPSFRWVFPRASLKQFASDVQVSRTQWFDVWNTEDYSDHEQHQAAGLCESVHRVRRVVRKEAELLGGQWDHIILAGLSQGAATALHTLINLDIPLEEGADPKRRRLGACLGFCCRMPFANRTLQDTRACLNLDDVPKDDEVVRKTPILLQHCSDDRQVSIDMGRMLRDLLQGFGAKVTWNEYANGGHGMVSPYGMDDAKSFLSKTMGISPLDSEIMQWKF